MVYTYKEILIGMNPLQIEHIWQLLYRGGFYRGGPIMVSAISGIEQALWDIKGKYYNMPVYEMLGGKVRDRIRVYPHMLGDSEEEWIESIKVRKSQGYTAIKGAVDPYSKFIDNTTYLKKFLKRVENTLEVAGDDIQLALDFHGRLSPAMAKIMCKELEKYNLIFVEEPVLPENLDALVEIKNSTVVPIATGERIFTKWGFDNLISRNAASIYQPDICHAGGIFECRKIAAMAESKHCAVAPHNPLGPISLAACLQLDACTPNFFIQEHPGMLQGWDAGQDYLKERFIVKDGYIEVNDKPGLGIEVNEDVLKEMSYDGKYANEILYDIHDGSLLEW